MAIKRLVKKHCLDAIAALAVGGALLAAYGFAQRPDGMGKLIADVLLFAALRIAYEMTLNRRHVPTIASAPAVRRQVAALIARDCAARRLPAYKAVDLGAGQGALARAIARGAPQAQIVGVERAWLPHWRAKLVQKLLGPRNLSFERGDLFSYDCHNAQAVVLFLGKLTVPVGEKLWCELAPRTLVISNDFELAGDWPAPEARVLRTPFKTMLYIYRR